MGRIKMKGDIFMLKKALILALTVGSVLIQPAVGKGFPTKAIEIVCPYTPGSSTDIACRVVADIAPKYLKQPVVVVNKAGGAGSIAAADVIGSKPDGYKLYAGTSSFFGIVTKTQKIPFDPTLLIPLENLMEFKLGACVKSDSPWKTLQDLLDYGKKNPGKLRWGHSGRGVGAHIAMLLIFKRAGVETIDIPYKGTPEITAAILGGHVDAGVFTYATVKEHKEAGNIRFLVVFSNQRYSDPSDVPSAAELGFPEVAKLTAIFSLYAHRDTPEDIKNTLMDAFKKTTEDPEFKKGIIKLGEEPRPGGPEFVKNAIKKSDEAGVPLLKELGLYIGK
jgi:tripartite-type tricarboxylate transporter receptor subunit TctC